MKIIMDKYLNEIKDRIIKEFPIVTVEIEEFNGDYFVAIDNEEVYDSDKYQHFMLDLTINYIMKNKLSSIYLVYK